MRRVLPAMSTRLENGEEGAAPLVRPNSEPLRSRLPRHDAVDLDVRVRAPLDRRDGRACRIARRRACAAAVRRDVQVRARARRGTHDGAVQDRRREAREAEDERRLRAARGAPRERAEDARRRRRAGPPRAVVHRVRVRGVRPAGLRVRVVGVHVSAAAVAFCAAAAPVGAAAAVFWLWRMAAPFSIFLLSCVAGSEHTMKRALDIAGLRRATGNRGESDPRSPLLP